MSNGTIGVGIGPRTGRDDIETFACGQAVREQVKPDVFIRFRSSTARQQAPISMYNSILHGHVGIIFVQISLM